ncbi:MAG: hypothetical protein J5778_07630 [Clostridiales bacterium]|nr:hypothetical protein [Clostridiales bacterium]
MAEDLIFDDQTIVDLYGEPIKLSKGMSGRIVDVIDSHGDTIGYDYINVHFKVKDGKTISAAISFDRKMDSSVLVLKEGILDIRPVFDISKIEYPQTVLSEYKLSRERYFTTIRMIRIIVVSISVVIAMGLSFAYFKCFKYKTNNKKV